MYCESLDDIPTVWETLICIVLLAFFFYFSFKFFFCLFGLDVMFTKRGKAKWRKERIEECRARREAYKIERNCPCFHCPKHKN